MSKRPPALRVPKMPAAPANAWPAEASLFDGPAPNFGPEALVYEAVIGMGKDLGFVHPSEANRALQPQALPAPCAGQTCSHSGRPRNLRAEA